MTPLEAALDYARLGWLVVPLWEPLDIGVCSCPGRSHGRDVAKHPRTSNGKSDASTDEAQIREWWRRWPKANIAVALPDEKFFVVDIDPCAGGDVSWERIRSSHEPATPTVYARTGSGGYHGLYRRPPGIDLRGKFAPGIDLPSSYFIVEPSLHGCGEQYRWIRSPFDNKIAEAPAWLLELASARACAASSGANGRHPVEATHAPAIGLQRPDTSDSGSDAREALRLLRRGATDAEIANELRGGASYQKRLPRGESIAAQYLSRTIAFARSCPDRAVSAVVRSVYLDARAPFGNKPAWAVLKLTLVTGDGEILPRAHVVVPSPGYESSQERFEAVAGDLDLGRLLAGDRMHARQLVGREVLVTKDGRWIRRSR